MVSVGTQIAQLEGLLGTQDLTLWEQGFVTRIAERASEELGTAQLSSKQVDFIERLWRSHFDG